MPKEIDYVGRTFGKLTAVRYTGKRTQTKHKKRIWEFQCACGNTCEKIMEKVALGWIKSCGCLRSTRTPIESLQWQIFGDSQYRDGNLTFEDFLELSQQNCYWCGEWRPNCREHRTHRDVCWHYHGLDRIQITQPHNRDNVVTSCWPCNERRSNWTVPQFLQWIQKIYKNRIGNING